MAKRGARLPNGELEALIMDALWNRDAWMVPGEITEHLEKQHPVAYTTVTTTLVRLWNRGMVDRRTAGRAFAYHPIQSRDEWAAQRMHEFLETSGDNTAALSHFVSTLDTKQLGQLRRAVNHKRSR